MKKTLEITLKGFENYLVQKAKKQILDLINSSLLIQNVQNFKVSVPIHSRTKSDFRFAEERPGPRLADKESLGDYPLTSFECEKKISVFSFPQKRKEFTVIRSPHIDKKARDQFQLCTYKTIIQVNKVNEYSFLFIFLENLKNTKFLGIQMQIKINSNTFGPSINF